MAAPQIVIKFDGGDALEHAVDMKLLGRSLIGFERIISDGIILISENRLPKKFERAPLRVLAREPKYGSQVIWAFLHDSSGLLPLGWQLITVTNAKIIWEWVSFVLKYYGGRRSDAQIHLDAMIEMRKIDESGRAASEERWHAQMGDWRDQMFALVEKLAVPSGNAVAPVGPSVRTVGFASERSDMTEVDVPMADAIRAKGTLEISDLQEITLRVDGYTHHNKALKVERPDNPGRYMSADIRDPLFETVPNPYTQAAEAQSAITVMAKIATREQHIERIYVMSFVSAS